MGVGGRIKTLRKQLNLSQKELSDGICTQTYISKVENNDISPSGEILWLLAKRLGVNLDYLIASSYDERYDYSEEVLAQLKRAAVKRDYKAIQRIVQTEEKNPYFKSRHKRILLWFKGTAIFYLEDDLKTALSCVEEALSLSENTSFKYDAVTLQILISNANLYSEAKQYSRAYALYEEALSRLKSFRYSFDIQVAIKLYYNYAVALRNNGYYQKSNDYLVKGVHSSREHHSYFILGDIYFYIASNHADLNDQENAKTNFKKALMIYELTGNDRMYRSTEKRLNSLLSDSL